MTTSRDPVAEHRRGSATARHHPADALPVHRRGPAPRLPVRPGHPAQGGRGGRLHRDVPHPARHARAPLSRAGRRPAGLAVATRSRHDQRPRRRPRAARTRRPGGSPSRRSVSTSWPTARRSPLSPSRVAPGDDEDAGPVRRPARRGPRPGGGRRRASRSPSGGWPRASGRTPLTASRATSDVASGRSCARRQKSTPTALTVAAVAALAGRMDDDGGRLAPRGRGGGRRASPPRRRCWRSHRSRARAAAASSARASAVHRPARRGGRWSLPASRSRRRAAGDRQPTER